MIESRNRQGAKASDWPPQGKWPETDDDYKALEYVCDCCSKSVVRHRGRYMSPSNEEYQSWPLEWGPKLVEVGGVTYYGCSQECARILFDIHHRYSQLDSRLSSGS